MKRDVKSLRETYKTKAHPGEGIARTFLRSPTRNTDAVLVLADSLEESGNRHHAERLRGLLRELSASTRHVSQRQIRGRLINEVRNVQSHLEGSGAHPLRFHRAYRRPDTSRTSTTEHGRYVIYPGGGSDNRPHELHYRPNVGVDDPVLGSSSNMDELENIAQEHHRGVEQRAWEGR